MTIDSKIFVRFVPRNFAATITFALLVAGSAHAGPLFREIAEPNAPTGREGAPVRTFEVDLGEMQSLLLNAPAEDLPARTTGLQITLPLPDGTSEAFEVWQAPVMHPELAAQYPEIRTYAGRGLDDRTATVRLDTTPHGFHAMILSTRPVMFIDPVEPGNAVLHTAHFKGGLADRDVHPFSCEMEATPERELEIQELVKAYTQSQGLRVSNGTELRTYRIAIAATGEYTTFHGGTVALGLAAITTSLNRVTGIYEREVSVRMELVPNNNLLVYTNSGTDPYTNANGGAMLGQNQANLDTVIGSANYDIGHVFSTGGGGVAGLGVVCRANQKARGVTGTNQPVGDNFDVDFVAHEMGHQFGGTHSFNGTAGNCAGNRTASTAYEPGSGTTIMAYAGICSPQNITQHSHADFHGASYDQIVAYTHAGQGGTCPVVTATGNTPPSATAGNVGHTIPIQTPFILFGVSSDVDGDPVTHSWEEFDLGPAGAPETPSGNAPIFRSFPPVTREWRMFPRKADVRNNTITYGELYPTYSRTLNFRLTVRDNLGGVANSSTTLSVDGASGPFLVTSIDATPWEAGTSKTITWDVAGTDVAPVSCASVNILLSTDNGDNFTEVLATATPNDGSEVVVVPPTVTTLARIQVEAADNVFLDMNNTAFEITPGAVGVEGIVSVVAGDTFEVSPNPFSQKTAISFATTQPGPVNLAVYDAAGRHVRTLVNESRDAGTYVVDWSGLDADGTVVAPGIYFMRLETSQGVRTKRSLYLR